MTKTSDTTLGSLAILSASFYLPLTFWASNAWDIGNPMFILLYGTTVSLFGLAVFLVAKKTRLRELSAALGISLTLMVLMSWQNLPMGQPLLATLLLVVAITIVTLLGHPIQRWIAAGIILLFGVTGVAQVTLAHMQRLAEVPLVELTTREPAAPTDAIEDVLVVVVDSYPSVAWAEQRFGHDMSHLKTSLAKAGLITPAVGWSQHPNTSFSVSALMELKPVVDPTSDVSWSNSHNLASIIGGENLVASTLRGAGFEHTQFESGWHQGQCSHADVCVHASWINETTWGLLEPSVIGGWLTAKHGSWIVPAALNVQQGVEELAPQFNDGNHDFVFAHLMLPHGPYVVDEACEPRPSEGPSESDRGPAIRSQLSCTDLLLSKIVALTDDRTAVLVTGDHGIKSNDQLDTSPESWTEEDIVDAFTVLLSYKLPKSCAAPHSNTNTIVMSAIIECATTFDAPANSGEPLIGLRNHRWVDPSTQRAIELRLESGWSNKAEIELPQSAQG